MVDELITIQELQEQSEQGKDDPSSFMLPVFFDYFLDIDEFEEIAAWWTPLRDIELRRFWKKEGLLASTIYNMQAVVSTVNHRLQTEEGNEAALELAESQIDFLEFGKGYKDFAKKLFESWTTQDNGIFIEVIGPGKSDTPLLEPPTSAAHLDPERCWRTADLEFPVIYVTQEGKWIKYHWTRVFVSAANPSGIETARGIGFCAVSRIIKLASIIRDTIRYKKEKISGRQTRALMTISGAPKSAVEEGIRQAAEAADNARQFKFSLIPLIAAPDANQAISADLVEFAGVPDGFDWQQELTIYLFSLALAFGIDARELWPASQTGATKADAEVQHKKAMRKGLGDFLSTLEQFFNSRLLPDGVKFEFLPEDREEDQLQANLEKTKVETAMMLDSILTTQGKIEYLVDHGVLPDKYLDNTELVKEDQPVPPQLEQAGNPFPKAFSDEEREELEKKKAILDPNKTGEALPEESVDENTEITQDAIMQELANWDAISQLATYTVDENEVGDIDELPTS